MNFKLIIAVGLYVVSIVPGIPAFEGFREFKDYVVSQDFITCKGKYDSHIYEKIECKTLGNIELIEKYFRGSTPELKDRITSKEMRFGDGSLYCYFSYQYDHELPLIHEKIYPGFNLNITAEGELLDAYQVPYLVNHHQYFIQEDFHVISTETSDGYKLERYLEPKTQILRKLIVYHPHQLDEVLNSEMDEISDNYATTASLSVSLGANVNPAFVVQRTSPTVINLISGSFPILNVNIALVLSLRAILGSGEVVLVGDVNLSAGDIIGLYYIANGLNLNLNLSIVAGQPGVVWSMSSLN